MPMLDPAMFDQSTYANPGMLAQLLAQGGAPPPGWAPGMAPPMDVSPPPGGLPAPPMSSGDGGAIMPVPPMPQSSPATPDMAALSGAYGSDRAPPKTDVPETSMLGRIGSGIGDFLKGANQWRKDNRSTLMALGAGMAGSQSLGQGLNRGMTLALPAQQHDLAQQKQNQTVKWLVEQKHMSPQEAETVVNNPEMLKQILPRLMGARELKWGTISKDFLGNEEMGFRDEAAGKVYDRFMRPLEPDGPGGGGGGLDVPNGPDGRPLEGKELLEHWRKAQPAATAGIEAIIRGDINAGGRNLQKLLPYAAMVDKSLHQWDYANRAKTNQFYKTGPGGMESKSANTAVNHLDDLREIDAKLGGFDIGGGYLNPITQGVKGLYDSKFQDAKREWDSLSETAAVEIAKTINGGKPHVGDEQHWRSVFSAASTPTERKAAIRSAARLIEGRRTESESNYNQGMGPAKEAFPSLVEPFSFINPRNQEKYDRLLRYGHETESAAPATGAVPGTASAAAPIPVKTLDEARKLPKGTRIIIPDGTPGVVP